MATHNKSMMDGAKLAQMMMKKHEMMKGKEMKKVITYKKKKKVKK